MAVPAGRFRHAAPDDRTRGDRLFTGGGTPGRCGGGPPALAGGRGAHPGAAARNVADPPAEPAPSDAAARTAALLWFAEAAHAALPERDPDPIEEGERAAEFGGGEDGPSRRCRH
jgi:hypothetical protein